MAHDDTRSRLLAAAGPVFADKGYQAATIRDICLAAGVNVASVNYYFGDKATLYLETVKLRGKCEPTGFPCPTGARAHRPLSGCVVLYSPCSHGSCRPTKRVGTPV